MSVSWRMLLPRQKWKLGKKGKYRKEGPTYIVFARVTCSKNSSEDVKVKIGYVLRRTDCWEEYLNIGEEIFHTFYDNPEARWAYHREDPSCLINKKTNV